MQRRAATSAPARPAAPSRPPGDDPFGLHLLDAHSTDPGTATDPHAVAAAGVAGAGTDLPHGDAIRASFGHHAGALAGVRAHVGGAAAEAAGELGADGYATGADVAFAASPELHLAAHEAAHVVQQRGGVALAGGLGAAGDASEHHADRAADGVVRGVSVEAILDEHAGGAPVGGAVQRRAHAPSALDAAIRALAGELDVATALLLMSTQVAVTVDVGAVVDAATLLAATLGATTTKPAKATVRTLEVVGDRLEGLAMQVSGDDQARLLAAVRALVARAADLHVALHPPGGKRAVGKATDEDHEVLLATDVRLVVEQAAAAKAEMGTQGEVDRLHGRARTIAALLRDARRHVGAAGGGGGGAARFADEVGRLVKPIDALYAWGRAAHADLATSGLEEVFDLADQLDHAVARDQAGRAGRYYADQPADGDKTQAALIDEMVQMFTVDKTVASFLAIDQFETILSEPPVPPEPDLLETMLRTVVGAVCAAVPGHVGGLLAALAGTLDASGAEGESATPTLPALLGTFAEHVTAGVLTYLEEGGAGGDSVKTDFLALLRSGLFGTMRMFGETLATYRQSLVRLPPAQVKAAHGALVAMGPKLWKQVQRDVIVQWVNLRAMTAAGVDPANPNSLDPADQQRWHKDMHLYQDAVVEVGVRLDDAGDGFPTAVVRHASIDGLEASVLRELRAQEVPLSAVPLHRRFTFWTGGGGYAVGTALGTAYLNPVHELDVSGLDGYYIGKLAHGGKLDTPWNAADHYNGEEPLREGIERAKVHVTEREAQVAIWRILHQLSVTTADLDGGEEAGLGTAARRGAKVD